MPLPKGAGPGTDNSQAASRGLLASARRMLSGPKDIHLPNATRTGKSVAIGAMRGLLKGNAPSPSKSR